MSQSRLKRKTHRRPSRSAIRTGLVNRTTRYRARIPSEGYKVGVMERGSNGRVTGPITPLLQCRARLTNETEMPAEWPVNKEPTADDVFLRHRPPVATIIAVVAVVAHGKVTMR